MNGIHAAVHAATTGAGAFLVWLLAASAVMLAAGFAATRARRLAPSAAYGIVSLAVAAPIVFAAFAVADLGGFVRLLRPAEAPPVGAEVSIAMLPPIGAAGERAEWPCALAAIWIAGACLALGRLARAHVRWRSVARRASALSLPIFERTRRRLGVAADVASSRDVTDPTVVGLLSPRVILPEGLEAALTETELESVVLHELSHVRRRDNLSALLHDLVFSLAWFDPFHWIARRRLVELAERACDAAVLDGGGDLDGYLLALGKACAVTTRPVPVSCMSGFRLRERMKSIMTYSADRSTFISHRAVLGAGAAVIAAAALAFAVLAPAPSFASPLAAEDAKHTLSVSVASAREGRVVFQVHVRTPEGETVMQAFATGQEREDLQLRTVTDGRTYDVRIDAGANQARLEILEQGRLVEVVESGIAPVAQTPLPRSDAPKIDLHLTDADLHDVLKTFSQLTGTRIVADPALEGRVTASFDDTPWDVALAEILRPMGLTFVFQNGEIVVMQGRATPAPRRMTEDGMYRVGGDVRAPQVLSRTDPIYPAEAKAARISGIVILEITLDANGVVRDVVVVKGLPFGLNQAAIDAVRQWVFAPATLEGKAVPVVYNMTVNFKLGEETPGDSEAL